MIKINCCCRDCKRPSIYDFDETMLCQPCFMKHIKNYDSSGELQKIKNECEALIKKRSSRWYNIKLISFFILFTSPVLYYIYLKFGFIAEFLSCIYGLLTVFSYPLSKWLSDRF